MGSITTSCERECMIAVVDKAASEYQREINFFRSAAQRIVLVPTLTSSLHTRRTQTRFLFEHLQRRHGSVDGINDVSANSVLL